ncbi:hypothetical protein BDV23DRAFT_76797 [Aspergillus alliaceus]|uniref:Uncharacterized protein n=1 Tax=Petromyces alliaceus TaxID=209559 RepID=A0A5N7C9L9_PETAA|nr:hypothetical protein BDV23DRAFT_76797 [Aspergillus alliaceus]
MEATPAQAMELQQARTRSLLTFDSPPLFHSVSTSPFSLFPWNCVIPNSIIESTIHMHTYIHTPLSSPDLEQILTAIFLVLRFLHSGLVRRWMAFVTSNERMPACEMFYCVFCYCFARFLLALLLVACLDR